MVTRGYSLYIEGREEHADIMCVGDAHPSYKVRVVGSLIALLLVSDCCRSNTFCLPMPIPRCGRSGRVAMSMRCDAAEISIHGAASADCPGFRLVD